MQALSEYSSQTAGGELDLSVTVTSAIDKSIVKTFKIVPDNALIRQQADVSSYFSTGLTLHVIGEF